MNVDKILWHLDAVSRCSPKIPSCKYIIMSDKTLSSGDWKEDTFLKLLMKYLTPVQFPIISNNYVEDGKILFYKPNSAMQLLLEEYRNFGRGRTVEFCKICGFRMIKSKPTPRNIELICSGCLSVRKNKFDELMKQMSLRDIFIDHHAISKMGCLSGIS